MKMYFILQYNMLCLAALLHEFQSFTFIPEEYLTEKICRLAVEKERRFFTYFDEVPSELIDYASLLEAYKIDACSVYKIPEQFRTEEILLSAVKVTPVVGKYIPEILQTPEFYQRMIIANPRVEEYLSRGVK